MAGNTKPTTLRLTPADKANAQTVIASGLAIDLSSAVRIALALVAKRIVKGVQK